MAYDGFTAAQLAARFHVPQCFTLVRVTSTLDVIHELAADGAPGGTLVIADEQVAGRGRQGRRWHSPAGSGIWLGYLSRRDDQTAPGVLGLRVGLALVGALRELDIPAAIKWPNDVIVDHRKLAGVLCEARWDGDRLRWVAIGIGINVKAPLANDVAATATTLDSLRPGVQRVEVLDRLVPRLGELATSDSLTASELEAYAHHDWLRGKRLVEPIEGQIRGVDAGGALIVETPSGTERLTGGHVVTA